VVADSRGSVMSLFACIALLVWQCVNIKPGTAYRVNHRSQWMAIGGAGDLYQFRLVTLGFQPNLAIGGAFF
jgi:hypothetical protein